MESCGFGVAGAPSEDAPSQPWPHILQEGKLVGIPPKFKADNPPMLGPAGTVHCSLRDWGKFIAEVIATWHGEGEMVKDKKLVARYFAPSAQGSYTHGGWGRDDARYGRVFLHHDGSNTFNYASALVFPEERAFVLVTTNSGQPGAERAAAEIARLGAGLLGFGEGAQARN